MEKLNATYLGTTQLNRSIKLPLPRNRAARLPERIIQFGEGAFLRAFADEFINRANGEGIFGGRIVVVQPIEYGRVDELRAQDHLYTVVLRGTVNGAEKEYRTLVTSISRSLKAYGEWDQVLACAEDPDIDIVISNTTEAGIELDETDTPHASPPASFPGKLTMYLHHRWQHFKGDPGKGMLIIPVELIDRNADRLKAIILELASRWGLGGTFINWVKDNNLFCNSMVDRIVTGYPVSEAAAMSAELGYDDVLLDTGEPFALWAIEGSESAAARFPLHELGDEVIFTSDYSRYRERKVRMLNGSHTALGPLSFMLGLETVGETMDSPLLDEFWKAFLFNEIVPSLPYDGEDMEEFAFEVMERFRNPFIRHEWRNILMNSASKVKTRILPSITGFVKAAGELPRCLVFAFAAYLRYAYVLRSDETGYYAPDDQDDEHQVVDTPRVLETLLKYWEESDPAEMETVTEAVRSVMADTSLWDADLTEVPGFTERVQELFVLMITDGVDKTFRDFIKKQLQ